MAASTGSKGSILLTGANGTLGSAIVASIVSSPELSSYHGLYTVRDPKSSPALDTALKTKKKKRTKPLPGHTHPHDVLALDLSSLTNVRECAEAINTRVASGDIPPIRVLILNAGYLEFTSQAWTEDGFDLAFASNYLGHWLLTLLLLQSMDVEHGRIVVVGSESHDPLNPINKASFPGKKWKTFLDEANTQAIAKGTWSTTKADPTYASGYRRYGASKFCQAMMIGELQRRLDTDPRLNKLCVLGVDPGRVPSSLTRRGPWFLRIFFGILMPCLAPVAAWLKPNGALRTARVAARDVVAGGLDSSKPWGERPGGLYFYGSRPGEVTPEARDVKKRELLWTDSVVYAGLKEGDTVLENWS